MNPNNEPGIWREALPLIIVIILICVIATCVEAQEPCPDPSTLAVCIAEAGIETIPQGQHIVTWASTLPADGTPVQWTEWRITFREYWPQIAPDLVAQLESTEFRLVSRVKIWIDQAHLNGYVIDVRAIDGQGNVGEWSVAAEQEGANRNTPARLSP